MMINMEVSIINPDRMAAARWHLDQPLPQPWNGKNTVGDQPPEL
jgi:hypothetical protein